MGATVVVIGRGSTDVLLRGVDNPTVADALHRAESLDFDWNGRQGLTFMQDGVEVDREDLDSTPLVDGSTIIILTSKPTGN